MKHSSCKRSPRIRVCASLFGESCKVSLTNEGCSAFTRQTLDYNVNCGDSFSVASDILSDSFNDKNALEEFCNQVDSSLNNKTNKQLLKRRQIVQLYFYYGEVGEAQTDFARKGKFNLRGYAGGIRPSRRYQL